MMIIPEEKEQKVFGLLGLARRARAIVVGMDATISALAKGNASLVLIANDIGKNSLKKIQRSVEEIYSEKYIGESSVPLMVFSDSESIGLAVNKKHAAILGIVDEDFARGIINV